MPSEQELLRTLDDEPRVPSTVDVRRAIVAGRRRQVRRRAGYAGAAAVTVLAVAGASMAGRLVSDATPGPAATPRPVASTKAQPKPAYQIPGTPGWTPPPATPPTSCTLDRLEVPDRAKAGLVSNADPSGRYIVGRAYPRGGGYQAVLWDNGKVRKVVLPGDIEESLSDVNSAGLAVGWSWTGKTDADMGPVPYAYQGGRVTKLPGVVRGQAEAVNEAGAIAGEDSKARAAVVWPSATAKPIRLPVPKKAESSTAGDIDEDGTTVGTIDDLTPYVWFSDGTHRPLPLPKGVEGARAFTVRNGWATGIGDTKGNGTAALRWNVRTGEVRVFDQFLVRASTANAHGWQVGTDQKGRGLLVTDSSTVVLPDLAIHRPGELTNIGTTLSDDGRLITGQADEENSDIQAVVWRCA
jgi:hypothetical protein